MALSRANLDVEVGRRSEIPKQTSHHDDVKENVQ